MGKIIGIDLAPPTLRVAIMDGTTPRVLENAELTSHDAFYHCLYPGW
ncbi:hypothetical protein ACLBR5_28230 [Escherichia coli]